MDQLMKSWGNGIISPKNLFLQKILWFPWFLCNRAWDTHAGERRRQTQRGLSCITALRCTSEKLSMSLASSLTRCSRVVSSEVKVVGWVKDEVQVTFQVVAVSNFTGKLTLRTLFLAARQILLCYLLNCFKWAQLLMHIRWRFTDYVTLQWSCDWSSCLTGCMRDL